MATVTLARRYRKGVPAAPLAEVPGAAVLTAAPRLYQLAPSRLPCSCTVPAVVPAEALTCMTLFEWQTPKSWTAPGPVPETAFSERSGARPVEMTSTPKAVVGLVCEKELGRTWPQAMPCGSRKTTTRT